MFARQQPTSSGENNICVGEIVDSCKRHIDRLGGRCRRFVEGIGSEWPEESWKTFFFWILSIIIDPLVLYVPRINDEKKLLHFGKPFLSILLGLYLVIWIYKLRIYCYKIKKLEAGSYSKLWMYFVWLAPLVPIITNMTLQLSLLFNATKNIRASVFSVGMAVYLILYLVRVLGIYRLFVATALRKSAIFRVVINVLLYLYGGHLFGGLWYFFAVWKKMQCWSKACTSHGACFYAKHRFIVMSGDNTFLDDMCFIKTGDTTNDMGIFKNALESHIVESSNLAKKLLYCLRWGIQNLSGYGQGLEVSTHTWENIFVLVIAVYGMSTFAFFIGNMQNLIKPFTGKSGQKGSWTREDLEKWSPFGKLTREDQNWIVEKCQECNWPQTGVVNVKNLLSNLPMAVENDIKYLLCSKLLRNAGVFETWSDEWLDELCKCAMPVSYEKHTQIIQNGSSIDEMLFVVEGKLRIYSFTSENAESPWTPGNTLISHREDVIDGFSGEELVGWFRVDPNSSELPISLRTIRVIERVDAFAIMAYDLRNISIKRQESIRDQETTADF